MRLRGLIGVVGYICFYLRYLRFLRPESFRIAGMCGRFALIVDASVLADVFDVDPPRELQPRFNIAPTQTIPIVRASGRRRPASARWSVGV